MSFPSGGGGAPVDFATTLERRDQSREDGRFWFMVVERRWLAQVTLNSAISRSFVTTQAR